MTIVETMLVAGVWLVLVGEYARATAALRRELDHSDPTDGLPDLRDAYRGPL